MRTRQWFRFVKSAASEALDEHAMQFAQEIVARIEGLRMRGGRGQHNVVQYLREYLDSLELSDVSELTTVQLENAMRYILDRMEQQQNEENDETT